MSLIIDHLYLSPIMVAKDSKFFETKNVTHVLIAAKHLKQYQKNVIYKQLDLADNAAANIAKYFVEAIEFIHEAVSAKKNILVHCAGGVSRSTSFVIAYMMFIEDLPFDKAFEFVKGKHERTNPNKGFLTQLQLFETVVSEYRRQITPEFKDKINYKLLDVLIIEHIRGKPKKE